MLGTLENVATVHLPLGRFEILKGEWPKPIEFPYIADEPVVSSMFFAPSYRVEARIVGSRRSEYKPLGKTFMIPADHELMGRGTGGAIRVARCLFEREAYQRLVRADFRLTEAEIDRSFNLGTTTINLLMRRLMEEVLSPGFASEILMESITSALLIECGRQIFREPGLDAPQPTTGLQPRHVGIIDEYLEGIEVGVPRIADLAELCGFSSHYFAKLFRQATGQSLGRYVAEWRMRRAQRLLVETTLPLKEIAYRLGFANAANFSTAFSKELHQTPGAYRKMHSGGYVAAPRLLN